MQRTILVTGASSGIGRAVARNLLQQGHCVLGTARNTEIFTTEHALFTPLALDLSKSAQIERLSKILHKDFSLLDGAVFSAGYGRFAHLEEFSFTQIEHLMQVNFIGQAQLTRAILPLLKKQQHSHLIYIGSEAALQGRRQGSIYCASKFALRGFTQALRDECGNSSVRVSLINPGMVDTPFFEDLSFMPGGGAGQFLQSEDIAETVLYILQSAAHMTIDEINLNPNNKVVRFKGANK